MAFLIPDYYEGPMYVVETDLGSEIVPADLVREHPTILEFVPFCEGEPLEFTLERGHWARLSAPGYMDATEWHGPFATIAEARVGIVDSYDVNPDTGEALPLP